MLPTLAAIPATAPPLSEWGPEVELLDEECGTMEVKLLDEECGAMAVKLLDEECGAS